MGKETDNKCVRKANMVQIIIIVEVLEYLLK